MLVFGYAFFLAPCPQLRVAIAPFGEGVWDEDGRAKAFVVQFFDAKEVDLAD
jgi:hypothetical protein